ncbi:hypothetical protein E1B28_003554 [Marasmius oreades]|uniref:Mitochondrial splicing suppressor 51-like C-terminal domain-containing protein n=1 Tax=Marasmius oreades TaxID=181124 RepID=A0A9P7RMS7_9AGAR|nr:uncharacterized protein E1B28_003554 [Marasmius oreades]KAG7086033.1 hypothetical protein E1B28_003554 [Marasmius oreades]
MMLFSLSDQPSTDLDFVNELCQQDMSNTLNMLGVSMKRGLRVDEQNFIGWQPRCMACSRTDRLIRLEGTTATRSLKACDACNTAFYCSQDHWDAVRDKHTTATLPDEGGLTQCQINKQFRTDMFFINLMANVHAKSESDSDSDSDSKPYVFQWAPTRHKVVWKALKEDPAGCWEEAFGEELKKEMGGYGATPVSLAPFLRAASEGLSMPMTILYALQKLKKSSDDWTRKRTLTVHILGSHEKEYIHAQLFDEILHRLPRVKDLRIVMIGPELSGAFEDPPESIMPCLECSEMSQVRRFEVHPSTYHEYVKKQGARYTKPDVAVAFNSGASDYAGSWKETMKLLVTKKVPTVFTAFNRQEAEVESKLLKAAGATLVPGLGPCKNPWGSLKLIPEPNRVTGFYSTNGWLAGGFC